MSLRAKSLLASALWLAGVSARVAALLYDLGAHEVAVVELSVGAGLVTVLLLFARYGFMPNRLDFCGGANERGLFEAGVEAQPSP